MSDQDLLDTMRSAITALGLGQCAPEDLVAAARTSATNREQERQGHADARARIKELEGRLAEWRRENDALEARIATVESAIEATHTVFDGVGVAWSMGNEATRLPIAKRAALLGEAEKLLLEEAPYAPVLFFTNRNLISPRLMGFTPNPRASNPTRFMSIKG
jgi:hypothetical protein